MADHDHSYKQLFSHPELVRDLLEGFVREDWVADLALETLERVNGSKSSAARHLHALAAGRIAGYRRPATSTHS
ncbi:hypothetical protein ACLG6S_15330 [Thermodesulfobacteriota bacterium B35]